MASMASLLLLILTFSHIHFTLPTGNNHITDRKSLEIIIGGGDDGNPPPSSPPPETEPENCPPPPPEPPCPPPPKAPQHPPTHPSLPPSPPKRPHPSLPPPRPLKGSFESELLKEAYPILQRFRNHLDGDSQRKLVSWKGSNVCAYRYISCSIYPKTKTRAIYSFQFNGLHLTGKLDKFLGEIETVSIFHANSNNFTGTVPNLTKLKYLFELDLSNNQLTGDFPATVLDATTLTFLDLRFNGFSGSVPSRAFNLDVDLLFINNNNLVQALPPNLGSITALYLTFANNKFTGQIPDSIGNIKFLQEVIFLNNQLTGCLPYQIGNLNRATVFDVGSNKLTGPIPYSFGCLVKMELLNLARNKFYGTIPEIVCEISCLQNVSLSYNYFTQAGPKCRELIKRKVLDVRMNCILDLPNQKTPQECADFFMRKQSCPSAKSMFLIPCGKKPNRFVKPDQQRLGEKETQAYHPLSHGSLNPERIRYL